MTLGERIYKLRTEKEMSQGDLADALEVSRQSISKWETNGSVPELDKLVKLSGIFGVSLDELVTGKEKAEKAEEKPLPPTPTAEPQIIYIEKPAKQGITAAQILGIMLSSLSLLCFVIFDDLFEALALCLPVAIWGVLCIVTKHPLLWCSWCGSVTWWVCVFVLSARWEKATLLLMIGVLLVIISLTYTIYLHKNGRIHVPVWCWGLLTIALAMAALLLMVNLIPPSAGAVTRPSEITSSPNASVVPNN